MRPENDSSTFAMSRHRRTGITVFCLLAAILLIRIDNGPIGRAWLASQASGKRTKVGDVEKYHGRTFTVRNVLDGDTLDVDAPDGRIGHTRIRLLGIDTPETDSGRSGSMYFALQAAKFTSQSALGKSVTVYLDRPGPTRGKYGRLLAYLKLPDGRFLNEILLAEGFAYADLRFTHSLFNKYRQLESSARNRKKGLWEAVTHKQLPEWLRNRMQELPGNARDRIP